MKHTTACFAKSVRQRAVVDFIVSAAAPCTARLQAAARAGDELVRTGSGPSGSGKDLAVPGTAGIAALVRFLEKPGIAEVVQASNVFSAEQFSTPRGTLDEASEEALNVWQSRVLPTLAALALPCVGLRPSSPCRDLAEWSRDFLAGNPTRRNKPMFRKILSSQMSRGASMFVTESFASCKSESSEEEVPPAGVENEINDESDSDNEGHRIFESFLSARSSKSFGGTSLLNMLGLGLPGPSEWEFARGAEEHGWDDTDATEIQVRGPTYLRDKEKVASSPALLEAVHADIFDAVPPEGYPNIGGCPNGVVAELRKVGEQRFLFVVNFCMPPLHLACVFAFKDPPADPRQLPPTGGQPARELFRRFVEDMGDEERSQRFKVIPWVREGPWLVQRAVGRTPAIIGKSIEINYFSAPGDYMEVSVNIFSSAAAKRILSLLKGAATHLTMEVYFVLEGKTPGELPEQVLGGFRIAHIDLARTRGPI